MRFSSLSFGLLLVSSLLGVLGCSASPAPSSTTRGATGGTGNIVTADPNGGAGNSLIIPTGGDTTRDPNDMRDVPVREKVCDAAGKCTCLRLALLGSLASAAVDSDSDAFVQWLNSNSDGTATLSKVPTKPTMDAAFLAQYDILLVANVNGWAFSDAEKAAVANWAATSGGGIITITGFTSTATEAADTSQLVSFAGMGYKGTAEKDWTAPSTGETYPVYYKGGTVDLKQCMEWNGGTATGATHTSPRITTPIKFTPQAAGSQLEKLTVGLDYVGAFIGWPALAPAGSTVLAKDPISGGNMAVAYEYQGKGRIFTFGDEWVIFSNQWAPLPGATSSMPSTDAGNKCYVAAGAAGNASAFFYSVQNLYQTKQFWYDVINWVAPPNECNFTVKDPDVIPK